MATRLQIYDESLEQVRLACMNCDRDDMDGIPDIGHAIINDWQHIEECNVESHTTEWWTHLGWCPDCVAAGALK